MEDKNQIGSLNENKVVNHKCDFCDKTFDSKKAKTTLTRLKEHVKTAHLGFGKCEQCDRIFGSKCSLTNHIKRVHNNEKYPCETCEKTFNSNE